MRNLQSRPVSAPLNVPSTWQRSGRVRTETGRVGRRGVSLIELMVTVTMIGVLASFAVPSFRRAVDQSRADIAAANLRALWFAERCYWLDNRTYTTDLEVLESAGLIDPVVVAGSSHYVYSITAANASTFTATATRVGSDLWSGEMIIDETGVVTGEIQASGQSSIIPGFQ